MYSKIRDKYFTIGTAVDPDPKYHSRLVSILINRVMKSGKKTLATRIVNKALQRVEKISKRNPLDVLETAVIKAAPQIQLKSSSARKTRRRTKLVPVEIPGFKSTKIAIKWLVDGTDIRANSGTKKSHSYERPYSHSFTTKYSEYVVGKWSMYRQKKVIT